MNKKNSLFVITGIFLICTRFWVSFGTVNIDISNDIVGYILIFLGINNMKELNSRFKKGMFLSLAGLAGAILSQYLIARDWPVPETMYSIAIGISVVFAIYFTYYYTEALVMEARIQEKTAVTRNYQITWLLMSAGIFVHYFAFKSTIHFLTNIKLIFTLFVCTVRWLTFARRSVLMMSSARKDINYEKVRDYYQT